MEVAQQQKIKFVLLQQLTVSRSYFVIMREQKLRLFMPAGRGFVWELLKMP